MKAQVKKTGANFIFSIGADMKDIDLKKKSKVKKSDNSPDMDVDAGIYGVEGKAGQVAMRVGENPKCDGCVHYDKNLSACRIGLVPLVCGDGSHPEIGYAPIANDAITHAKWVAAHSGAIAPTAQVESENPILNDIPYRIEVLGDSALTLAEKFSLVKAAAKDPAAVIGHIWYHQLSPEKRKQIKGREGKKPKPGVAGGGRPPTEWWDKMKAKISTKKGWFENDIVKAISHMSGVFVSTPVNIPSTTRKLNIGDFADMLGTTEDIVRSIAAKLGDRTDFIEFIKSKLPDLVVAHGITEAAMTRIYKSAHHTIKSLSPTEWEAWKGVSFENDLSDEHIARAIAENGLLDQNSQAYGSIVTPAHMHPRADLPEPEALQNPTQNQNPVVTGFVGGNLALADVFSNMDNGINRALVSSVGPGPRLRSATTITRRESVHQQPKLPAPAAPKPRIGLHDAFKPLGKGAVEDFNDLFKAKGSKGGHKKPYGHTAYTKRTKSGKMVQVQARGVKPSEPDLDTGISDEPEYESPSEGDYMISDARHGGYDVSEHGGHHLGTFSERDDAESFIRHHMEKNNFWPNVWTVSDHGNLNLINIHESKKSLNTSN